MAATDLDDPLALERQACFALAVANRAILSVYRPILAPLGLTHPQYLVMLALWGKSPQSVKELAAALQLDSATISPLLKRLASAGLLTRLRNANDERQLDIELTADGVALRQQALGVPEQVIARLGSNWDELGELHRVLTSINQKAIQAGALPL
ncbi:transcriptional regulator, MarR family [Segniliparus rotundus DSM 44985]|uniref:Transcriptional regulator, MarR family n=1 Tax=Segniliparus rotundus (strain ATCC BAA-972 / CDC 1076 / CIP 108378 / DSM 44985 / JCM 13578) TaxID=640132 RepID=D6Z7W7_SEGRD|nr:MarR family transcriptional regulator [Segniliparus rotundus]ADG98047.1 transcriptional regulator, MarR family [Segniliparus rotundus DSM 44985]